MRHVVLENEKILSLSEKWSFKESPYNKEHFELERWPRPLSAQEAKEYLFLEHQIDFGVMDTNSQIVEKLFNKPPVNLEGPLIDTAKLKPGLKVYQVNASGWIAPVVLASEPYESEHTGSLFIDFYYYNDFANKSIKTSLSLLDYNVIPNSYNENRLFTNLQEALQYLEK